MGSAGIQTSALAFGGGNPPTKIASTESWDGTSWTEVADLATARTNMSGGGAGTATQALAAGGNAAPGDTAATEEWEFPPATAAILTEGDLFLSGGTTLKGFGKAAGIPAATWASGGSANTARFRIYCRWRNTTSAALALWW